MADNPDGRTVLDRAQASAARGRWAEAFELYTEADAGGLVGVAELPALAHVAYAAGHLDLTIETWERAYVLLGASGDSGGAAGAAVRVAMHLLFDTSLMAPVRGWLSRAEQLLDDEESAAFAWLAAVRSYERLLSGDHVSARAWARRAIDVGSARDQAAAAIGRVAEARLVILEGDVDVGLALLEEVGVAVVSADLDALSTGVVYCELVCTLQGLAQYDLAEQWTEAMERWSQTNAIGSIHGRCRVHRAEILRLRGSIIEAEEQALLACTELRPYMRRELGWPLNELGRIRLRRGDVAGARDALVASHRAGWDPEPTLALVHLAEGDLDTAAACVRDALEHPAPVPSKELPPSSGLRRAPLLDAQVEIGMARGDVDVARAAARELETIATRFASKALLAGATQAQARVRLAEGDIATAERLLADSIRAWTEIGAPYETARARLHLSEAHRAAGNEHRAGLERDAARAFLDDIEFPPIDNERHHTGARDVFRHEGDYWTVSFQGRAVRVRDIKGMHYLARFLGEPGHEFHVLDLVAAERGSGQVASRGPDVGDAGEMLDAQAKSAYRRRLAEIETDIDEARTDLNEEREAQAELEREFLVRELARAVGLGGRDRRAGSSSERARVAVTRAVRKAMARIAEHHPELGDHLERTIRTGTYCVYLPDPRLPTDWGQRQDVRPPN